MVFSSVPVYQLDPPQHKPGGVGDNHHLPPPMPPPPLPCRSIRPNSVSERARVTDFQKPERAQICPRCESTNTKFCYFNNYSLSQPRHFCKTCRRYWTRGGALRNVPVGGGCRRNKKTTKRSKLKSQVTRSSTSGISSSSCAADIIGQVPLLPPLPQFPILPSIHHISDFGAGDVGLPFGGIQTPAAATAGGQWRPLQFPFLVGPEQLAGMPEFQSEGVEASSNCAEEVTGLSHTAAMQSEDQNEGVNLPDNFSGFQGNDYQYWSSGNAWTDLNGFSYPSTSHLL